MTSRWRCECGNFNNNHAPGCTADYERTQRLADALEPGPERDRIQAIADERRPR